MRADSEGFLEMEWNGQLTPGQQPRALKALDQRELKATI